VTSRVACLALLLALVFSATGMATLGACWDTCPDDDASGRCFDDSCCDCCFQARVALCGVTEISALDPSGLSASTPAFVALTADPRDILHVPLTSPS
jgi:hypothetical protein